MADPIVNEKNKLTRDRVRELMSKQNLEEPVKNTLQRERFLAVLKKQYGYTNDKAVDEMERLLKQFHVTNRSLTFHRPRRTLYKHTHAQ